MSVWIKKKKANLRINSLEKLLAKMGSFQVTNKEKMCKQPAAQAYQGNSYCEGIFLVCGLQMCQGAEAEVVMVGGGVGAMLRITVLPVPACLALSALPCGAVPESHGVMAPWSLDRQLPMGTEFLTNTLFHFHSMEQALVRCCGSGHLVQGSLPSSLGARCGK